MSLLIPAFAHFENMLGVWTGTGKAQTGATVHNRVCFSPAAQGAMLRMEWESSDTKSDQFYHGVLALLCLSLEGPTRAACVSSRHGAFVLAQQPDDPGVLVLGGVTPHGMRIQVSFVPEDEDWMLLTASARPASQPPGDGPQLSVRLRRQKISA